MKAVLEFDLNNIDDSNNHVLAVHANEMAGFIWELKHNIIRRALKDGLSTDDMAKLIHEQLEMHLDFNIDTFYQ